MRDLHVCMQQLASIIYDLGIACFDHDRKNTFVVFFSFQDRNKCLSLGWRTSDKLQHYFPVLCATRCYHPRFSTRERRTSVIRMHNFQVIGTFSILKITGLTSNQCFALSTQLFLRISMKFVKSLTLHSNILPY